MTYSLFDSFGFW